MNFGNANMCKPCDLPSSLQWWHYERDGVSNHRRLNCSGADQRKHQSSTSMVLCEGNAPFTGGFLSQMASNAENVSIWSRRHVYTSLLVRGPTSQNGHDGNNLAVNTKLRLSSISCASVIGDTHRKKALLARLHCYKLTWILLHTKQRNCFCGKIA